LRKYKLDPPSFGVHLAHQISTRQVALGKMYIVASKAISVEWWVRVREMDIRGAMGDAFIDDEHIRSSHMVTVATAIPELN
jgi:hypothetical protein